jgi:ABC-type glycerol-3-phosphate transport system permease component
VLKALFLSFFIVLIVREITTFISSFFGYVFKKKKKIKKGYFKDFWDNYKFMDFKKIFLGRFIKF